MGIGDRIRFFRKKKGLTQKQLGLQMGYSDNTADVRIAQYESNKKMPNSDTLEKLVEVLDVCAEALLTPNLDSDDAFMHTLFLLEDEFGLQVKNIDDEYHLVFDPSHPHYRVTEFMLADWHSTFMGCLNGNYSQKEYNKWRYNFPHYTIQSEMEKLQEALRRKVAEKYWNLSCVCIQAIPDTDFQIDHVYEGKLISASHPQKFNGELIDEGFLVRDDNKTPMHFHIQDFPTYFKIQ